MSTNNGSDNNNKSEKVVLAIVLIIIAAIIIYIIYTIFMTNENLNNNTTRNDDKLDIYKDDNTNHSNENNIYTTSTVEEEIASYTTTIYDKDENRVHNISLANSKLNNHIIKPNEEFSFNNTIGPMGGDMGYKKALGFDSNGKKIEIYAGGLCQISSTLYNTALIAGFEITERHAHSARVYYVPKDKDATILYGSLDLKFINNTDSEVKIIATNDNANVTIKLVKLTQETKKVE